MKVYIFTDLEGATGVVAYDYGDLERRKIDRVLLMQDVNAAVAGVADAGANSIVVCDGHGKGSISLEKLDSRAALIKKGKAAPYLPGLDASYDFLVLIGFHAMAGTDGVLSHTYSLRVKKITINGEPIGEIGLSFIYAQCFGVQPVFVSGDQAALDEARRYIPAIHGVAAKEGISDHWTECLSPQITRRQIEKGVFQSLSKYTLNSAKLPRAPYEMEVVYKRPWIALPRYLRKNRFSGASLKNMHTIVIKGSDFTELMDKFIGSYKAP